MNIDLTKIYNIFKIILLTVDKSLYAAYTSYRNFSNVTADSATRTELQNRLLLYKNRLPTTKNFDRLPSICKIDVMFSFSDEVINSAIDPNKRKYKKLKIKVTKDDDQLDLE